MNLFKKVTIILIGFLLFCFITIRCMDSMVVYAEEEIEYTEDSIEYQVWHYLEDLGYNDYAIAGAMGNMYWESHFEPEMVEYGGTGYGLVQWTGSRQWNLVDFCNENGWYTSSVYAQVMFFEEESDYDSAYYNWMNGEGFTKWNFDYATTVEESTSAFFHCYERAYDDTLLDRIYHAYRYYDYFTS